MQIHPHGRDMAMGGRRGKGTSSRVIDKSDERQAFNERGSSQMASSERKRLEEEGS